MQMFSLDLKLWMEKGQSIWTEQGTSRGQKWG